MLAAPASAASKKDWADCEAVDEGTPDRVIAGCTRVLAEPRWVNRRHNRAVAYNNRCAAYNDKSYEHDKALADCNQAIRLDPKDGCVQQPGLRLAHQERTRQGDRGLHRGDPARSVHRRIQKPRPRLESSRTNSTRRSRTTPRQSGSIRGTPTVFNHRGSAWRAKNELDKAIADFTEAIRLDPKPMAAVYNRGLAWKAKNELDKAIADYTEAIGSIRRTPTLSTTAASPGQTRMNSARRSRTTPRRSGSIRRTPTLSTTAAEPGQPRTNSARRSRTTPRRPGSIRNPWPRSSSAGAGDKNELDKAITDYTEAVRLEPKDADRYRFRGYAYFHKGDFGAASADFLRSIELKDDAYPMLFRYLARGRAGQNATAELEAQRRAAQDQGMAVRGDRALPRTPISRGDARWGRRQAGRALRGAVLYRRVACPCAATVPRQDRPCRPPSIPARRDFVEYIAAVAELKRLKP